jgi:hypothetical protein
MQHPKNKQHDTYARQVAHLSQRYHYTTIPEGPTNASNSKNRHIMNKNNRAEHTKKTTLIARESRKEKKISTSR